jgi:hypothetical protein
MIFSHYGNILAMFVVANYCMVFSFTWTKHDKKYMCHGRSFMPTFSNTIKTVILTNDQTKLI